MKVSIIGGGGLVGSSAGFALQCGGIVREIALLDVNQELAAGQAQTTTTRSTRAQRATRRTQQKVKSFHVQLLFLQFLIWQKKKGAQACCTGDI